MSIWNSIEGAAVGLTELPGAGQPESGVDLDVATAVNHNDLIRLSNFTSIEGRLVGNDIYVTPAVARAYAAKLIEAADRVQGTGRCAPC